MSTTPNILLQTTWLPMHPAQQEVYYDQLTNPESPHYNIGGYIVVHGALDRALVQRIVGQMPTTFDALRLLFDFNGLRPQCRFAPDYLPIPMPVIDFRQFDKPADEARHWMQQRFNAPFNLANERLIEVALLVIDEEEHWLFNRTHHLICDALGFSVLTNYIARQYTALTRQDDYVSFQPHPDYEPEVRAGDDYLTSAAYQKDRAYWLAQFETAPPPLLTKRHLIDGQPIPGSQSLIIELPNALRQTFDGVANTHSTSLQQLTIAALMIYFGRVSEQTDFVLGVPVYNRRKHQWNVMGMFAGLIPFRSHYQPDQTVGDLLRQVRHQQFSDYRHQNYPVSHLNRDLHLLQEGRSQLFDVVVNYLLVDFNLQFGGLPARTHDLLSHQVENPLQFWWRDYGPHQPLELRVDFQRAYFTETEARWLANRVLFLIEQFADQADRPVSALSLLPPGEQAELRAFNPAPVSRPASHTLLTELERQARQHPGKSAVEVNGQQTSYLVLHLQADQLAAQLQKAGAKPGTTVAISSDRSLLMFVSLLAVLKTGATYVAIPPDYPADRQRWMLTDSGATIWIGETQPDDLPDTVRLIDPAVTLTALGARPAAVTPHPTDAAYLIYTSGSTGQPKGVLISQASLLDYCLTVKEYFGLTPTDRVIQQASMAFDTMVEEIYPAWLAGACVVLMEQGGRDIDRIADYIENRGITLLSTTPSVIQWLNRKLTTVGQLRYLISGGEVLHPAHVDRLVGQVTVVNTYGPSESTVCVTYQPVSNAGQASILGRPITNRSVVILDEAGALTPLGEIGELCIGGAGLMLGYHNRPDLTAERMRPNPFDAGERLYRSGDLARWLADGTLEYMGRRDEQVKIRGYRIELGEVEAALQAADGVGQAAIAVRSGPTNTPRLIGYYVPEPDAHATDATAIMGWLRRQLPDYMLPAQLVCLPELPLLPNGKLDKAALPDPATDQPTGNTSDQPTNAVEACLVDIWQGLFNQPAVGIHDNFFALGGDSIITLQVVSRMRKAGYTLQPRHLFECPTIAQLAPCVTGEVVTTAETGLLTGDAPMLPIQRQFLDEQPRNPAHYNQAMLLEIDKSVSAAWLRGALAALLDQHDALRLVFTGNNLGTWTQYYAPTAPDPLVVIDLQDRLNWQPELADESRRAQASLNLETGALLHCLLVQTPDSEARNRLLLTVHHVAIDGVSWRILVEDLLAFLAAKASGQPILPAEKTASYRQWALDLGRYAQADKTVSTLDYWEAAQADQTPLPADFEAAPAHQRDVRTTQRLLSEAATTALLTTAHRPYRTQVNDLLLTAFAQTITDWADRPSVVVGLEGHGRELVNSDLDSSHTVGWFTVQYPVALKRLPGATDRERIRAVKEQLRAVPDKGLSYGALRYLHPDYAIQKRLSHTTPFAVSFNYLGQLDALLPDNDWLAWTGQPVAHTIDPANPFSPAFDVNCYVMGGQLVVDWAAAQTHYRPETTAHVATAFIDNLTRLIDHCGQTEQTCPTPSDFQLAGLATQTELDAFCQAHTDPTAIEAIYRLSPLQEGMLFHSLYDGQSIAYTDQLRCLIDAAVDTDCLRQSWEQLMRNHSILRSAFPHDAFQTPLQVVYAQVSLPFAVIDLSELPADQQTERADQLAQDDLQAGFDLQCPPLLRLTLLKLAPAHYEMIWTNHHLLTDGWSLPVIIDELMRHYRAFRQNGQPLPQPPDRYEDFIRLLDERPLPAEETFWADYVADLKSPTLLPFVNNRVGRNKGVGAVDAVEWTADADLARQIQVFLLTQRITINTLCQGVWAYLLAHYTQQTDVTFGVTVSGRPTTLADADSRVGLFINTLPFRAIVAEADVVGDWLQVQQQRQASMQEFQHKPLRDIQQLTPFTGDWFDSLLVVENYPMAKLIGQPTALPIRSARIREQTNFLLTLVVCPDPTLLIRFAYQPTLLRAATVEQIAVHFEHVLRQMVSQPQRTMSTLRAITPAETAYVRGIGEQTTPYAEAGRTVVQLIERQVRRQPGQTALIWGDQTLSYDELNRQANQLAHLLRDRGVCRGGVVGLCLERSFDLLVGLLAVLKAGGAYVPIDPSLPASRMHYLLDDSGATVLLCQQRNRARLVEVADGRLCLPIDVPSSWQTNQPDQNPWASPEPADSAYCLYTSGSTGRPKGVRITHHSLTNYLLTCLDHYIDREQPGQTASFIHLNTAFDASVTALFTPLIAGKTVVIAQGEALAVFEEPSFWQHAPYDFLKLTPAQLPLLAMAIQQRPHCLPPTTRFVVGGEALLPTHYQHWLDNPQPELTIINEYGPTEATVGCCWYAFRPGQEVCTTGGVLIGTPMPNVSLYVLDAQRRLVAPGVVGELYIGGLQLAEGYQQAALTADRFVTHEWGRLYRTGDLVAWQEGGQLAYCGRCDDQVKLGGYRIELGEIEGVIAQVPGVAATAVVLTDGRLIGYVVLTEHTTLDQVEEQVRQHLPAYMVPAGWMVIERLPLTSNGKVDRRALPVCVLTTPPDLPLDPTEQTPAEQLLIPIWQRVLGRSGIVPTDNFFTLGGDSVNTIQVASQARKVGLMIHPKDIFDHPVLTQLAQVASHAVAPVGEQGMLTGEAGLLPIQQQFLDADPANVHHFNQGVLLRLPSHVGPLQIQTALQWVVDHHDALRFRYRRPNQTWTQTYAAEASVTVETATVASLLPDEQGAAIVSLCEARQSELRIDSGPLMRCLLIRTNGETNRLFWTIHHLAVDAVSWRILLDDFQSCLLAVLDGQKPALGAKTTSYRQWQQALQTYAASGPVVARQVPYWRQILSTTGGLPPQPVYRVADVATHTFALGESATRRLLTEAHHAYRTEVSDLVLTALAQTLSGWLNQASVVIGLEGHGREPIDATVDTSRTAGWFTSLYPVQLTANASLSLSNQIRAVKEALRAVPDKGLGYGALRYLHPDAAIRSQMAQGNPFAFVFNYLGQFDALDEASTLIGLADEAVGATESPENPFRSRFEIDCFVRGHRLVVNWRYVGDQYDAALIQTLADRFCAHLYALIDHCAGRQETQFSPADFGLAGTIDISELDQLLHAVAPETEDVLIF